jgi:hypothetical protein
MAAPPVTAGGPSGLRIGAGKGGNLKATIMKILAWVAFVFGGLAASPLIAATFVGGIVDNLLSVGPDWLPPLTLFLLVVFIAVDLFADMIPNRMALYGAMALVSVARSVSGRLGDNVERWANEARTAIQPDLQAWLGTGSIIAMAGALAVGGWLVSRRTMAAKSTGR